ncbi:DASH complex subunit DAM1 [Staphylotrichum tortipilum]|uniref:DASH complex subunit DAM1 n=1 Tax=Staphylotrichum tortipilum TaxID=2831512 RepID=A0AAN6MAI5_9PEZI|nr:DASH complex subunit DAM1 [Staphylotrichum longicolle]
MAHDPPRRARSTSRSRPTTPLRPSSRSSFRDSARSSVQGDGAAFPLNTFEPAFAELSDAVADLEANMMHFQLMHESLARFSESFASFLYGLNMNAFCVDFPEGPMAESFRRMKVREEERLQQGGTRLPERTPGDIDTEATFMTTDTSFVENPPSSKSSHKYHTPAASRQSRVPAPPASTRGAPSTRGAARGARGGGTTRGTRPSGLARPRGRGIR